MKKALSLLLAVALAGVCFAAVGASAADEAYVEDGLVAFYDAGQQKAGDTAWADLAGENDITSVPNEAGKNEFKDGAYLNTATKVNFPSGIVNVINGQEFTTEIQLGASTVTGTTWGTYLNTDSGDQYSLFYRLNDDSIEFKCSTNTRPTKFEIGGVTALSDSTLTVVFKVGETAKIYINGVLAAESAEASASALSIQDFFFGHDGADKSHTTEYIKMRFYDRALTAEEVAANYAADEAGVVYGDAAGTDESSSAAESSETAASSAAPAESSSTESSAPSTGDAGVISFVVLAVVAAAGAFVVKSRR